MMRTPVKTRAASESIGKLCMGGDWACAHGDFGGLREVARQLAAHVPEPLHCELETLAAACAAHPAKAVSLWTTLKDRIFQEAWT